MLYLFGTPKQIVLEFRNIGRLGIMASIALAAQDAAICAAFLLTTAGNVAAIINLSPAFCALSDRFILYEPIPHRTVAMIIVGMIGLTVIMVGDSETEARYMTGNLVALVNPISWAVYWAIIRIGAKTEEKKEQESKIHETEAYQQQEQHGKQGGSTQEQWERLLIYQVAAILLACLCGLCAGFQPATVRIPSDLGLYTLYGAVLLPLCLFFFSMAPRFISTAEVGCLKTLEIVVIPSVMYIYNQEIPSRSTFIGGALILVAIAGHSIAVITEKRAKNRAAKAKAPMVCGQHSTSTSAPVTSDELQNYLQ
jgi:drug/metabolite transporter (DMT)-like permease